MTACGRVRSLDRVYPVRWGEGLRMRRCPGRELPGYIGGPGYRVVWLRGTEGRRLELVHRLVARAWLGEPRTGQVVNHLDGDKLNNRIENLEWVSQLENVRHANALGLVKYPTQVAIAERQELRRLYHEGVTYSELAERFGITYSAAYHWVKGWQYERKDTKEDQSENRTSEHQAASKSRA